MTDKILEQRVAELEKENAQLRSGTEPKGLYEKYRVVHKGTREVVMAPFVLVPEKDTNAAEAVLFYADKIKKENPTLAKDLEDWIAEVTKIELAKES